MAGLGDLAGLLKQAQNMQREIARIQGELKTRTVEGSSSGGAVRVVATGGLELAKIHIDPSVLASGDATLVEDMVRMAANQALERARELSKSELGKLTGGLSIPGMF
ncbi:MAG: YbaB/EbfC family nucleoid-associated protein [Planctomycetes bacterium]|nr:YbaB/EbfC family nucleoid-associated protein [Planctomycetota bacterium]MCC7169485.1 YbaB/EbfC family nucleoid-associated protein [Planctomycetota bacterium]